MTKTTHVVFLGLLLGASSLGHAQSCNDTLPCQCIGKPGVERVTSCHHTAPCDPLGGLPQVCTPVDTFGAPDPDSCQCRPVEFASAMSTTPGAGSPEGACYTVDLVALLKECIRKNQTDPPPPADNPGPFVRGYHSIVVLAGQCYGGGFKEFTAVGNNIVVGSAGAEDRTVTAHPKGAIDPAFSMDWLDRVGLEVKRDGNRPIQDIIERANVDYRKIDPNAMTPVPAVSVGAPPGFMVKLFGVDLNDPNRPTSMHALLVAGKLAPNAPDGQASNNSMDKMKDLLTKPPFGLTEGQNLTILRGTSYKTLQDTIKAIWRKMNDHEQFLFAIFDHGNRCMRMQGGQWEVLPDTNPNTIRALLPTLQYMVNADVQQPTLTVDAAFLDQPARVVLNGNDIGALSISSLPVHAEITFQPLLLAGVGADNELRIETSGSVDGFQSIALTTGPVFVPGLVSIPVLSGETVVVFAVLLLVAGAILLGRL